MHRHEDGATRSSQRNQLRRRPTYERTTAFNNQENKMLEDIFWKRVYPESTTNKSITRKLGVEKSVIDHWFAERYKAHFLKRMDYVPRLKPKVDGKAPLISVHESSETFQTAAEANTSNLPYLHNLFDVEAVLDEENDLLCKENFRCK